MKIHMTLSKTDRILALINYYLPHEDINRYHFEADSIAYNTRKNSSLKTIEGLIREYLGEELQGKDGIEDEELIKQLAAGIKSVL